MGRLPTRKGVPVWIPVENKEGRYGKDVQLYKYILSNKTVALPKPIIESDLRNTLMIEKSELSNYMKKELRRASAHSIKMTKEEQLESFVAKMPNIIKGMLAAEESGAKLPKGFKRRLNLILKKIEDLSFEERMQFYYDNPELFEDTTDWYKLAKQYAYKPADLFDLDEKDKEKLKKKGFDSYDDYVNSVYQGLGKINENLNKIIKARNQG